MMILVWILPPLVSPLILEARSQGIVFLRLQFPAAINVLILLVLPCDGSHTITVNASDYDGNAAAQKSVSFKIDTVPPTLSVTSPTDGLVTNQASCTVRGTTNDATSSPVSVTVKLNSGSAEAATVASDGSWSKVITLTEGTNTITVVATDSAGKSTTVTRTVKLDTKAPVIKSVTLTPNPVDTEKTVVISVEVTD